MALPRLPPRGRRLKVLNPHPDLTAAVQHAKVRPVVEGQALDKRGAERDLAPLAALELAVWLLMSRMLSVEEPAISDYGGVMRQSVGRLSLASWTPAGSTRPPTMTRPRTATKRSGRVLSRSRGGRPGTRRGCGSPWAAGACDVGRCVVPACALGPLTIT